MYHIKPDKRSQNTAREIVTGMQECLKTMPMQSVKVSDIHRATGISRTTFYRLFDTPEDILIYQMDQMMEEAGENLPSDLSELLEKTISQNMEYHGLLKTIVDNNRFDLLFQYTEKVFRKIEEQYGIFPDNMDPAEREYIIVQLSMSMVGSMISWNRSGQMENASQQAQYVKNYARLLWSMIGE